METYSVQEGQEGRQIRKRFGCKRFRSVAGQVRGVLAGCGLLLFFSWNSNAAKATLGWDRSPDPDVGGYAVYYGPASREYINSVHVGNVTTYTVSSLAWGATYYFALTTYNTAGVESGFSDEIVYTVPTPNQPGFDNPSLRFVNNSLNFILNGTLGQTVVIQSSTDLVHWVSIRTNMFTNSTQSFSIPDATNLMRAFRAWLP